MMFKLQPSSHPDAEKSSRLWLSFNISFIVGLLLLLTQVVWTVGCQFLPSRHFCWAAHNSMTYYTIHVNVEGEDLNLREIGSRYAIRYGLGQNGGWEAHSIYNIIELIEQAERIDYPDERAAVTIVYRVNGGEEQTWSFRE